MLNYLKKFALDILPSVAATIIGAYIVNHYINARPSADAPVAAAVSSVDLKKAGSGASGEAKPEILSDVATAPQPGIKAKGISERAMIEKTVTEAPATVVEKPQIEKPAEKSVDKPAETASLPAVDTRRKPSPAAREKAVAKTVPQVAAPVTAPPTDTAAVGSDDRRDANDLARAAIERLRGATEASRPPEVARVPETPRIAETPRVVSAPPVQPLPPPVIVSTPTVESPPSVANAANDPNRPTPPADIPARPPLDLRADASEPPAHARTNVAEDMLSAAKSMFHAVLPNSSAKYSPFGSDQK
jgi:hypothetical protein